MRVIREMASCGAQSIAFDECMSLAYVGEIVQEQHLGFIGNFHVTATLLEERDDPAADVQRCLDEGERFPGYVFGLGAPLTRHISVSRLDAAIAAYLRRRGRPGKATSETDFSQDGPLPLESKEER